MTVFKSVALFIVIALGLSLLIYPDPEITPVEPTQLPWHIELDDSYNSSVFGLTFNIDPMSKALDVFGDAESMALYADPLKPTIEVYFGTRTLAGLSGKIITSINISPDEANGFLQQAISRMQSNAEIPKIEITAANQYKVLPLKIAALTYMPIYSGLELDYLFERFGKPFSYVTLNENATQFFYPKLGLSIIHDSSGKELFQYTHPKQLVVPDGAKRYE